MATAAVQASPRMYGSDRLRVERKGSTDPFARRDNFGGSPRDAYTMQACQDMAMLFQRGVYAGIAQAAQAQAIPPPPVYAAYPSTYYQAYDPSQYSQYTAPAAPVNQYSASAAPVNHYTAPATSNNNNNIAESLQGPGHFQFGPAAQASAPSTANFQYPAPAPAPTQYVQPPMVPAGSGYQWPPASSNDENANASPSQEAQ